MKNDRAFTLVELVIVVAVVGILAAVFVPAGIRSRVAANESATIGDIRTLMSAQAAYRVANSGFYDGNLDCLVAPSTCIPSYPTASPTFLDSQLGSETAKAGYGRLFTGGPIPSNIPPTASATSVLQYRYDATPMVVGMTGVRGFAGDYTEKICQTADGTPVPVGVTPSELPASCTALR